MAVRVTPRRPKIVAWALRYDTSPYVFRLVVKRDPGRLVSPWRWVPLVEAQPKAPPRRTRAAR